MNILDLYEEFDMWAEYLYEHSSLDMPTAKDVCQDVFLELHEKYGNSELPVHNVAAWLHTILKRRSVNYIISYGKNKDKDVAYMQDFLTHARETRSYQGELEALFLLIPEYSQLMKLFYLDGLSYTHIARLKHTSEDAVKSRLKRARKAAQNSLQKMVPLLKLIEREAKKEPLYDP